MYGDGLVSKIYKWVWHPSNSSETMGEWAAGLVVILAVSFLWATNIKLIEG